MKAILKKASECNYQKEIEVNTLEDIINMAKQYDSDLIFSYNSEVITITVYDDYLE